MWIRCLHGFFLFRETRAGQISAFMSLFAGLELTDQGDFFTFESLADAPTYSLAGGTFLGAPTTETIEGKPWDIMRANGLVYDFNLDQVVPIETITRRVEVAKAGNYLLSSGLILPGSVTDDGSRVTDYAAWYLFDSNKFKYSKVTYESP